MTLVRRHPLLLACALALHTQAAAADDPAGFELFEREIRPLLAERCYECHSHLTSAPKGGLLLDDRASLRHGGSSGPAIVPGEPDQSRLIMAVRYADPELRMPPQGRLSEREIHSLERWVELGAPDPRSETLSAPPQPTLDLDAARQFWAFQPMADPDPPDVDPAWGGDAIDRFILARLQREGLTPAPPADRIALLRRTTFDLIGLPPTPEEVEAFVADEAPDAFARVVDRLLASPHYGERWGRHWLDLARYSDSNGQDENLAYGNAWRYRDYVVRAFNQDKPYDRFILEQIAGDLLDAPAPAAASQDESFDRLIATGFLVMGPKMLAEQDKDKLVLDVVDEQIDLVGRTFLGLTLGCARCHDHKFDPIATRDYYALAGVFKSTSTMENLDHVSRWREGELASPTQIAERDQWSAAKQAADGALRELQLEQDARLHDAWRGDIARILLAATDAATRAIQLEAEAFTSGNLSRNTTNYGSPDNAVVHTGMTGMQFADYPIQLEGGVFRLDVRYAAQESRPITVLWNGARIADGALAATTGGWTARDQRWFEGVARVDALPGGNVLRIERAGGPIPHLDAFCLVPIDAATGTTTWPADATIAGDLPPALLRRWIAFLADRRRDRATWLRPWFEYADQPAITLAARPREWAAEVLAGVRADGQPSALVETLLAGSPPETLRELAGRYQVVCATVMQAWDHRRQTHGDDATLDDPEQDRLRHALFDADGPFGLSRPELDACYPPDAATKLTELRTRLADLDATRPPKLPSALQVIDGEALDVPVHIRGNHLTLAERAEPRGALPLFDHVVGCEPIPPQASGRLQLARWIASPEHPLTARVLVNRIWQGHFGQGLVQSPSNFGLRGDTPSHPALLDHLARAFVRDGWSIKALHRRILRSATYQMSTRYDAAAAAIDPQNRLLWRQNRRRLEAEPMRDAILAVAGTLDLTVGGSLLRTGNRDYVTNDQSGNQAHYLANRRSIYLPVIRNAMYDLFAIFDFNDPSIHVDSRPSTAIASQALFALNSPLMVDGSLALARRLASACGDDPLARLDLAYRIAYGRRPRPAEIERDQRFLADATRWIPQADRDPLAPWQALCQVLLAASEFLYLD